MRKSKTTPLLLALAMAVCTNTAVMPATAFAAEAEAVIGNEAESTEEENVSEELPEENVSEEPAAENVSEEPVEVDL
jgi:spermidine/putrescine-binding protein